MSPIEAITSVFRNFINFSGRAGRPEFWWFTLFAVVSTALLIFVPFIGWIYVLVLLLPNLAVTVRRLHDRDQSGWWAIASFFPVVNWILLIYLAFPGSPGPNSHGPEPYGAEPRQQWGWPDQEPSQAPPGQTYQPTTPPSGSGTDPETNAAPPGHGGALPPTVSPPADWGATPGDPPAAESRSFCTHCGMQLQDDVRFCAHCGTAA